MKQSTADTLNALGFGITALAKAFMFTAFGVAALVIAL